MEPILIIKERSLTDFFATHVPGYGERQCEPRSDAYLLKNEIAVSHGFRDNDTVVFIIKDSLRSSNIRVTVEMTYQAQPYDSLSKTLKLISTKVTQDENGI